MTQPWGLTPRVRARLGPLRTALGDRKQRAVHGLRHSRPGPPENSSRVFNLDLHVSVIADIRTVLKSRGIGLVDWSLSGHSWVLGREREPVAVVNERTYRDFGPELVRRFQRVYGRYLRPFGGFVATHTPCFSLLYEGFPGPTLAVCSTRYEWPFTFEPRRWAWLDDRLKHGVETGQLQLVANNRADVDYVENYLGIAPTYVPSACSYITPTYTGRRTEVLVFTKDERLAASICEQVSRAAPLRSTLGSRYAWSELYDYRAVVLVPYNVSFMSLFEHYCACMPIYVPDREFLKRLMAEHPEQVLSQLSYAQGTGRRAGAPTPGALDLNDLRDPQIVDWYLDRADFYDHEWMPQVRQFESWAHLDHLLATDDPLEISNRMAVEKPARLGRIAELWDELAWLGRVARPDAT